MKHIISVYQHIKALFLAVVMRMFFFPIYILLNVDRVKLKLIIALNDKIAKKKALEYIDADTNLIFDKFKLIKLIKKKTIYTWS